MYENDVIVKGKLYEYRGYLNGDTIYVEIKYMGQLIETRQFISNYSETINGVEYKGIEATIKTIKFDVQNFGIYANGISYPADSSENNELNIITPKITQIENNILSNTGITFNSINDDELKKQKDNLENKIEALQNIGLPSVTTITKMIWEKGIKPKLLTKRQIIKKIIILSSKAIPIAEEDAQLIVYGKIYYKNNILYDNDEKDPLCVSHPGDDDYVPPIDENHPLWKDIIQKINNIKKSLTQLGIKIGEFAVLIPHIIGVIATSIIAMISSLVIFPPGSGIPTAITAVQNIITAIKQLQAKAAEFLPIIAAFEFLALLLPKSAQSIVSTILGIFKTIITIIISLTSILSLVQMIKDLIDKLMKKMKNKKLKIKAKADPNIVEEQGDSIDLSVEVSGGDYNYIYKWEDAQGNIISIDPNYGDDDGTREITPDIKRMNKLTKKLKKYTEYTCTVTDQKGSGITKTSKVKVYYEG